MRHAVALCIALLAGCSFALTHAPARGEPCPSSVPAGVDTYMAASSGVSAAIAMSVQDDSVAEPAFRAAAIVTAVLAAGFVASASHGFREVRACREQRARDARAVPFIVVGPPGSTMPPPPPPPPDVDVDVQVHVRTP